MEKGADRGRYRRISGLVTLVVTLLGALAWGLLGSRTGQAPALDLASLPDFNYYDEIELRNFGTGTANDHMAVSVRNGVLDFVVFYRSAESGYPKYLGQRRGDGLAVGHILKTSYSDRLELTNTRTAYEMRDGQILQYPIRQTLTPNSLGDFLIELRANPSIEGLRSMRQTRRKS